jgi:hypothetical protein
LLFTCGGSSEPAPEVAAGFALSAGIDAMSRVDEEIVRGYFEQNGFLVRRLQRQTESFRRKAGEERDLLVYNPAFRSGQRLPEFFLFASELRYVQRAVVLLSPLSGGRFFPGMLRSSAQMFRFLEQNVMKKKGMAFALPEEESESLRLLVVPAVPAAEPHRSQVIRSLQEKGVDGVLSFRSILLDLVGQVEINGDYAEGSFRDVVRLLKNYDLVKDPQMELFDSGQERDRG